MLATWCCACSCVRLTSIIIFLANEDLHNHEDESHDLLEEEESHDHDHDHDHDHEDEVPRKWEETIC